MITVSFDLPVKVREVREEWLTVKLLSNINSAYSQSYLHNVLVRSIIKTFNPQQLIQLIWHDGPLML